MRMICVGIILYLFVSSSLTVQCGGVAIVSVNEYINQYRDCANIIYVKPDYNLNSIEVPVAIQLFTTINIWDFYKRLRSLRCIIHWFLFRSETPGDILSILDTFDDPFNDDPFTRYRKLYSEFHVFVKRKHMVRVLELPRSEHYTMVVYGVKTTSKQLYKFKCSKVLLRLSMIIQDQDVKICRNSPSVCREAVRNTTYLITHGGRLFINIPHHKDDENDPPPPVYQFVGKYPNENETRIWNGNGIVRSLSRNPFRVDMNKYKEDQFTAIINLLLAEAAHVWMSVEDPDVDPLFLTVEGVNIFRICQGDCTDGDHVDSLYLEATHFVPIGTASHNFITCNGAEESLKFDFYIRTHDTATWMFFLLVSFILLPVLAVVEARYSIKDRCDSYFAVFASTLANSYAVTLDLYSDLPPLPNLNRASLFWMMCLITLVNSYKGLYVSDLVAPLKLVGVWKGIIDMEGFIFSSTEHIWNLFLNEEKSWVNYGYKVEQGYGISECAAMPHIRNTEARICPSDSDEPCSILKISKNSSEIYDFSNGVSAYFKERVKKICNIKSRGLKLNKGLKNFVELSLCTPSIFVARNSSSKFTGYSAAPFNRAFLLFNMSLDYCKDIQVKFEMIRDTYSGCEMSAYIGPEEEIDAFIEYNKVKLSPNGKFVQRHKSDVVKFFKGKQSFLNIIEAVAFFDQSWVPVAPNFPTILYNRVNFLLCSGIFNMLRSYYKMKYPNDLEIIKRKALYVTTNYLPEAVKIVSNILTVFYFLIIGYIVSMVAITIELIWKYRKSFFRRSSEALRGIIECVWRNQFVKSCKSKVKIIRYR